MIVNNLEGVALDPPEKKIMGLPAIKSSFTEPCKEVMKEFYGKLLEEEFQDALELKKKFRSDFAKKIIYR